MRDIRRLRRRRAIGRSGQSPGDERTTGVDGRLMPDD